MSYEQIGEYMAHAAVAIRRDAPDAEIVGKLSKAVEIGVRDYIEDAQEEIENLLPALRNGSVAEYKTGDRVFTCILSPGEWEMFEDFRNRGIRPFGRRWFR